MVREPVIMNIIRLQRRPNINIGLYKRENRYESVAIIASKRSVSWRQLENHRGGGIVCLSRLSLENSSRREENYESSVRRKESVAKNENENHLGAHGALSMKRKRNSHLLWQTSARHRSLAAAAGGSMTLCHLMWSHRSGSSSLLKKARKA